MKLGSIVGTRVNRFTVEEKIKISKADGAKYSISRLCDCGKRFFASSGDIQKRGRQRLRVRTRKENEEVIYKAPIEQLL